MQLLEIALILVTVVLVSTIVDQVLPRVSLPLIQVAVGLVIALTFGSGIDIQMDSELFLVLFIAPLLFDESQHVNKRELTQRLGSILSLAIGLVVVATLAVGFLLHWLVPSIPLAAAFALGAALGPTDAAAVSSMSGSVKLSERQESILSGEALFNDASGVVSFQFAVAAATTGAFSLVDASESFALSFAGGLLLGALLALVSIFAWYVVKATGLENTSFDVIFELMLPFFVFLCAEALHVSGILAVVAAGMIVAWVPKPKTLANANRQLVVSGLWNTITFMLNGIVFVMLGMELPLAFQESAYGSLHPIALVFIALAVTVMVTVLRFLWIWALEWFIPWNNNRKREHASERRPGRINFIPNEEHLSASEKALSALVMTLSGPKGAVTLTIAFTLPAFIADAVPFPFRDELIFIASIVVVTTLLVANFIVPLISPQPSQEDDLVLVSAARDASQHVVDRLQARITETENLRDAFALSFVARSYLAKIRDMNNTLNPEISSSLNQLVKQMNTTQHEFLDHVAQSDEYTQETVDACSQMLDRNTQFVENERRPNSPWRWASITVLKFLGKSPFKQKLGFDEFDIPLVDQDAFIRLYTLMFNKGNACLEEQMANADIETEQGSATVQAAQYLLSQRQSLTVFAAAQTMRQNASQTAVLEAAPESAGADLSSQSSEAIERPHDEELAPRQKYELDPDASLWTPQTRMKRQDVTDLRVRIKQVEEEALMIKLDAIATMVESEKITKQQASQLRRGIYTMQLASSLENVG